MVAALVGDLSLSNLIWVNLNLNGNASSVLMCTSVSPRLLPDYSPVIPSLPISGHDYLPFLRLIWVHTVLCKTNALTRYKPHSSAVFTTVVDLPSSS